MQMTQRTNSEKKREVDRLTEERVEKRIIIIFGNHETWPKKCYKNLCEKYWKSSRKGKAKWKKPMKMSSKRLQKYWKILPRIAVFFYNQTEVVVFYTLCTHNVSKCYWIFHLWSYKKKWKKGQKKREKKKQLWLSMKFAILVRRLFKQLPHPHTCTVGKIHNCRMQKIQIQIVLDKHTYVCVCVKTHINSICQEPKTKLKNRQRRGEGERDK